MDKEIRNIRRIGYFVIAIAFGGFGLWLSLAPLHGAVVTTGLLKVESHRKTVQHNEGGIVEHILVREGQQVEKGDVLLRLLETEAAAAYSIVRNALDAELARQARLEAEAAAKAAIDFPQALTGRSDSAPVRELMAREENLFKAKRDALNEQIRLLQRQIAQSEAEQRALEAQMHAEQSAKATAEEEIKAYRALRDRNFISTPRLLEQERTVYEYQSRSSERLAEIARTQRLREDLNLRILALTQDRVREAAAELKESTSRVLELSERIKPTTDTLSRLQVTSPVSGKVLGLRVHTIGASIAPREPIMEIVPNDSELHIEAQVSLDAVSDLYKGQAADIRFTALPYRSTPLIPGKVTHISADVQTGENDRPFFLVHVVPNKEALDDLAIHERLQAGMATEVYIRSKARTALEYMLEPITDSLARALSEQ